MPWHLVSLEVQIARHLDSAAEGDLAVALAEVNVAHAQVRALHEDREVYLAALGEVLRLVQSIGARWARWARGRGGKLSRQCMAERSQRLAASNKLASASPRPGFFPPSCPLPHLDVAVAAVLAAGDGAHRLRRVLVEVGALGQGAQQGVLGLGQAGCRGRAEMSFSCWGGLSFVSMHAGPSAGARPPPAERRPCGGRPESGAGAPRGRQWRCFPRVTLSSPAAISAPSRSFHMASSSGEGAVPMRPGWMRPGKRTPGM